MTAIPKPQRELDPDYLAYVRKQPCCVSGKTPVDAHHVRIGNVGGVGTKPSDWMAIPLHRDFHREFHDLGIMGFETKYGIDCAAIVLKLIRGYRPPKKVKRQPKSSLVVKCACGKQHTKGAIVGQEYRFWCTTVREYRVAS